MLYGAHLPTSLSAAAVMMSTESSSSKQALANETICCAGDLTHIVTVILDSALQGRVSGRHRRAAQLSLPQKVCTGRSERNLLLQRRAHAEEPSRCTLLSVLRYWGAGHPRYRSRRHLSSAPIRYSSFLESAYWEVCSYPTDQPGCTIPCSSRLESPGSLEPIAAKTVRGFRR